MHYQDWLLEVLERQHEGRMMTKKKNKFCSTWTVVVKEVRTIIGLHQLVV